MASGIEIANHADVDRRVARSYAANSAGQAVQRQAVPPEPLPANGTSFAYLPALAQARVATTEEGWTPGLIGRWRTCHDERRSVVSGFRLRCAARLGLSTCRSLHAFGLRPGCQQGLATARICPWLRPLGRGSQWDPGPERLGRWPNRHNAQWSCRPNRRIADHDGWLGE